jgi:putative polyhydroxyalkanoate system protein
MAQILIEREHQLGLAQARRTAAQWVQDAEHKFDMRCDYQPGEEADEVSFSRSGLSGTLAVSASTFRLQAQLGFLLSALCMATLVGGFESLGQGGPPLWVSAAFIATGLLSGVLYYWHSRHHPEPILDLSLLKIQTFRVSTVAGNLCRFGVGAVPYLLALMLQIGFGLSALSAGLITFAGAVGAMAMKIAAPRILDRWGYRRVLTVNAVFTGLSLASCAFFTASTPAVVMIAVLLFGGFFRSLQFTAINTLAYADISQASMSRASSFAAMGQQLGVSLGVGVAAETLHLSMLWRGSDTLIAADVVVGFLVLGVLCALPSFSFWRLSPQAGETLRQSRSAQSRAG